MEEIGELCGVSAAEVYGTATFYDMLHTEPVGRHVIAVCTNIACLLGGAYEFLQHAERRLGIRVGQTSADGEFSLEEAECLAGCDLAPCVQVNHRFVGALDADGFDALVDELAAGRRSDDIPSHGVLCRVSRSVGLPGNELAGRIGRVIVTDAMLRIVTSRVDDADSYTLSHYLETGGYNGLRHALEMDPSDVHEEVNAASLLGRGGAGFPAGRKWSMVRPAKTTYLVVNGDESEPATFKDHLLIERDPHQIIEGTAIAARTRSA